MVLKTKNMSLKNLITKKKHLFSDILCSKYLNTFNDLCWWVLRTLLDTGTNFPVAMALKQKKSTIIGSSNQIVARGSKM